MNDNTSTQLKLLSEENSIGRKSSAFLYDFCIGQCACQLRQAMRIYKSRFTKTLCFFVRLLHRSVCLSATASNADIQKSIYQDPPMSSPIFSHHRRLQEDRDCGCVKQLFLLSYSAMIRECGSSFRHHYSGVKIQKILVSPSLPLTSFKW